MKKRISGKKRKKQMTWLGIQYAAVLYAHMIPETQKVVCVGKKGEVRFM